MNKKRISVVGLILMIAAAAIFGEFTDLGSQKSASSAGPLQPLSIEYTRHARCRMGCRQISEQEIFEVLKSGQKNIQKSNAQASPCPVTALEGLTSDNQFVRVVYGQCGKLQKIITVIDLNNDFRCDCD